jgi:hypothetical protein
MVSGGRATGSAYASSECLCGSALTGPPSGQARSSRVLDAARDPLLAALDGAAGRAAEGLHAPGTR